MIVSDTATMKDYNRKSHVAYGMAPMPMTLSDLDGQFAVWNLSNSHTSGNSSIH